MLILDLNIKKIPVISASGQKIGRLLAFEIETDSQSIINYRVRPSKIISGLFHSELIINRGQVIDINAERILVDDNILKQKDFFKKSVKIQAKNPQGSLAFGQQKKQPV